MCKSFLLLTTSVVLLGALTCGVNGRLFGEESEVGIAHVDMGIGQGITAGQVLDCDTCHASSLPF